VGERVRRLWEAPGPRERAEGCYWCRWWWLLLLLLFLCHWVNNISKLIYCHRPKSRLPNGSFFEVSCPCLSTRGSKSAQSLVSILTGYLTARESKLRKSWQNEGIVIIGRPGTPESPHNFFNQVSLPESWNLTKGSWLQGGTGIIKKDRFIF
jgi:hypothetical protein